MRHTSIIEKPWNLVFLWETTWNLYHKSCAAYTFDFGRFAKVRCCQLSAGGYWPRARKALSSVRGSKTIKDVKELFLRRNKVAKWLARFFSCLPLRDVIALTVTVIVFYSCRAWGCTERASTKTGRMRQSLMCQTDVSDAWRVFRCLQGFLQILTDSYMLKQSKTQFTIHFAIHSFHRILHFTSEFHPETCCCKRVEMHLLPRLWFFDLQGRFHRRGYCHLCWALSALQF